MRTIITTITGLLCAVTLLPFARTPLQQQCTGCNGTFRQYNNSSCIALGVVGQSIQNGGCVQQSPCGAGNPCLVSGTFTVTNNCPFPIYIRSKSNTTCNPGTTVIQPGAAPYVITFNSDKVACGTTLNYAVYENDPGMTCPSTGNTGWYWTCAACVGSQ